MTALLVTLATVVGALAGWGATKRIYRLRIGYKCVRCGYDSAGWTLCVECRAEEPGGPLDRE